MKAVFVNKIDGRYGIYQTFFRWYDEFWKLIPRQSEAFLERTKLRRSIERRGEIQESSVKGLLNSLSDKCPEKLQEFLDSRQEFAERAFADGWVIRFWSAEKSDERLVVLQQISQMVKWIDEAVLGAIAQEAISSEDPRLRGEMCFALGNSGNPRFKTILLHLTEDGDEWARKQADIALSDLESAAEDYKLMVIEDMDLKTLWEEFLKEDESRREVFPATPEGIEHENCLSGIDPFFADYKTCADFNNLEKDVFQVRGQFIYRSWIQKQFSKLNVDWIVVVNGKVVKKSKKGELVPLEKELEEIGRKNNGFPFLFSRTVFSEESKWSKRVDVEGLYPTIPLEVELPAVVKAKGRIKPRTDIDTGSYHILYISLELLERKWRDYLPYRRIEQSDIPFRGKSFWYRIHILTVIIKDDVTRMEKKRDYNCLCILNWNETTFIHANPKREAFAGTELIVTFPLTLILDGKKKPSETRVEV